MGAGVGWAAAKQAIVHRVAEGTVDWTQRLVRVQGTASPRALTPSADIAVEGLEGKARASARAKLRSVVRALPVGGGTTLGRMLDRRSDGAAVLDTSPHISLLPGVAIIIVALAFAWIGDGLRLAVDPKKRVN